MATVTAQQVKDYTENADVQSREDSKLAFDIIQAECKLKAIFTNHEKDYDTIAEDPLQQNIQIAQILWAEYYAILATHNTTNLRQSETYDDYSYTNFAGGTDIEEPDVLCLLSEYLLDTTDLPVRNSINMRIRKL